MKIGIYGSGNAREHFTYLELKKSLPENAELYFYCYGNNAPLSLEKGYRKIQTLSQAVQFSREDQIQLIHILSPFDLIDGVYDFFKMEGLETSGVPYDLALLEKSKVYAKKIMTDARIPTPEYFLCNEYKRGEKFLKENWTDGQKEFVIKSDRMLSNPNLRALIPKSLPDAISGLYELMNSEEFGSGGGYLLIEEKLSGQEISLHVLSDGNSYKILPIVQDYKKLYNDDDGPNTDGVGSISFISGQSEQLLSLLEKTIVIPSIQAVNRIQPYKFVLYIGVMLTERGPMVLEYNVRPGNPEWQSLLAMIDNPINDIFDAIRTEKLHQLQINHRHSFSATLGVTANGYPYNTNRKFNEEIHGIENVSDEIVLSSDHTRFDSDKIYTDGGRVLFLTSSGDDKTSVLNKLYKEIELIHFKGMYYRDDVGKNRLY